MPLARSVAEANAGPLEVIVAGGPAVQLEMNPALRHDLVRAELVAGALSLIVLVLVLGSLAAGIVPLLLALFVIPIVLSIVFALSHVTDVTVFAPNVVTLVGLGIAIDYSLLVVYRFREELTAGRDVPDAVAVTMRTAVRAVIFSGVTVAIGLGVLLLVRVPFVRSFGLAGILIPAVTIIAALTLLPALMSMLGHRINRLRVVPEHVLEASESRPWRRVAEQIMRAPLLFLLLGGAIIVLVAAPVRNLALGSTPLAVYPDTGPAAEGTKLLAREFGLGGVAPVRVLVDRPAAEVQSALPAMRAAAGVQAVSVVPGPKATLINVFGGDEVGSAERRTSSSATSGTACCRDCYRPAAYQVGGAPAVFYDFQQALYGDFGWIALIVITATVLVLFRAFRSIVLPVKAVLMNVLSVAGAYGLLVAVFQHGVGADLVGFHQTEQIAVWIPLFLFAFLFGLSMDYEVFLLSRMREEYDVVPDNRRAVATGLAKTGKLITSAALIMVIAFCGLAASSFIEMQQFGFGLAAAILLDATLIRALIVPSVMKLMGRWNWWLPVPLRPLAGRGPRALTATGWAAPGRCRRARRCSPERAGRSLRLLRLRLLRPDLDDHVGRRVVRRELVLADHLAVALHRAVDDDGEAAGAAAGLHLGAGRERRVVDAAHAGRREVVLRARLLRHRDALAGAVELHRQRRVRVRGLDQDRVLQRVHEPELRAAPRHGGVHPERVVRDVEVVVAAVDDLQAGVERGVEQRRHDLADAAADGGDELAVLDLLADQEAARGGALPDHLVEVERLAGLDDVAVEHVGEQVHVVDPVRRRRAHAGRDRLREEPHVDAELLRVRGRERRLVAVDGDPRLLRARRCRRRRCSRPCRRRRPSGRAGRA